MRADFLRRFERQVRLALSPAARALALSLRPCFVLLILMLGAPGTAWAAKTARIHWKAIHGAKSYELELSRDGEKFKQVELDDPHWKGEIPSGYFTYRVRGIDRFKRPGAWSSAKPLFVAPPPPLPEIASGSSEIPTYTPLGKAALKWEDAGHAKAYEVVIRRGSEVIRTQTVKGANALEVSGLPPGDYQFQVRGLFPSKAGRNPASASGTPTSANDLAYRGEFSPPRKFSLKHEALRAPEPILPKKRIQAPANRLAELRWEPVEGATAYQVLVNYPSLAPGQKPWPARNVVVNDTHAFVPIPNHGQIFWKVRALAGIDPLTHLPSAASPQSQSSFEVRPESLLALEPVGYLALSTLFSPYQYLSTAPLGGVDYGASTSSNLSTLRFSGEYFVNQHWGLGAGADLTTASFCDQNRDCSYTGSRNTYELMVKYRASLEPLFENWFFAPKFGVEMRNIPDVIQNSNYNPADPSSKLVSILPVTLLGPAIGFDLRKQFTSKLGVGLKVSFFIPLSSSSSDSTLSGAQIQPFGATNLSLGIQGLYWVTPRWGLALGGYFDYRGLSQVVPANGTQVTNTVTMNSVNAFLSLIYTLWR